LAITNDWAAAQRVLAELGREALAEHGDWLLLHRERPMEMPKVELWGTATRSKAVEILIEQLKKNRLKEVKKPEYPKYHEKDGRGAGWAGK
jgi:hypothetical protein